MTKDIPIMFSSVMVRAILKEIAHPGQGKTMTRRLATSKVLRHALRGDTLWVREPCVTDDALQKVIGYLADARGETDEALLKATIAKAAASPEPLRERDAMYMPRWASRITCTVRSIRVEPLHAITEEDARAEGVESVAAFRELWDQLHHDKPQALWAANPEVIPIKFKPVLGNIDALAAARDALVPQ